ncbi:MAG: NAD(P)/FAD-dependent oxidoreductase [Pseudomonadota bacterium]
MTPDIETIIIGAGVIGLACARALSQAGREVMIIERHDAIGTETSSRNSEVIHAGLYYPQGSLKAQFCVQGRKALYAYCAERGIAHKRTGKLIVASDETQMAKLRDIENAARRNGVDDLAWLDGATAMAREPALRCFAALESPSTGIVDSHGLMVSLLGDAENNGASLALHTDVIGATALPGGFAVETIDARGEAMTVTCAELVLATGLHGQTLAHHITGLDPRAIPPQHYAKGSYFTLSGKSPFSTLIYPAPEQAGLGIHLTLDMGGQARFGPDVTWIDQPEYNVDPERRSAFAAAIRRYYPDLDETALQPGYAGIRPKIQAQGEDARDFMISAPADHGLSGLVALYGIESPGLTACLAIADHVTTILVPQQVRATA